jgi:hypothetical protein
MSSVLASPQMVSVAISWTSLRFVSAANHRTTDVAVTPRTPLDAVDMFKLVKTIRAFSIAFSEMKENSNYLCLPHDNHAER